MRLLVLGLAIVSLAVATAVDARGNPENGKAKATQVCAACHGADGAKPSGPEQPILAGQYYDYLVKALSDYKSGKRANPIMKAFADPLSKKEIEDLAAWFSAQKSSLHFQR
ncbi:MAG: cytochrome c [Betaproteobacteria bacterium]|nr:cytochrome c [Betaproteobacteria bacterium]